MSTSDTNTFDFSDLIIFEMSKNHGGDVEHALRITREFGELAQSTGVKAAMKLQFRDLNTYIHPAYREGGGDERMQRYFTSHLSKDEFASVVEAIKASGMISMSTPFDEPSVDTLDELGVEIIKIASSSAQDWPLLARVVQSGKPIVASTGGLALAEIDRLAEFLMSHQANFTLLHCIGRYPTPREEQQLNRLDVMQARYPQVPIGFSTHEDPNDYDLVKMAYAKGARVFEKHVVVTNERYDNDPSFAKVLGYTATPDQMERWIAAHREAAAICGVEDAESYTPTDTEKASIGTMVRGIYAKRDLQAGESLTEDDVFFAIPLQEGQLPVGAWHDGLTVSIDTKKDEPLK